MDGDYTIFSGKIISGGLRNQVSCLLHNAGDRITGFWQWRESKDRVTTRNFECAMS